MNVIIFGILALEFIRSSQIIYSPKRRKNILPIQLGCGRLLLKKTVTIQQKS
jgi:hypothetical protein